MTWGNPMRSTCCLCWGLCVAGIVLFLAGCRKENGASEPRPKPPESQSAGNFEPGNQTQTPGTPHIEPGTELTEANFKAALRDTGAKYVVIQVYMESCGPCMTEALQLAEKQAQWRASGVAILGLGMDETPAGPKAFDRHTGGRITYPLYLAPWFAEQQEVFTTPTLFVYRADGDQLFRTDPETAAEGVMAALQAKLSQLLDS